MRIPNQILPSILFVAFLPFMVKGQTKQYEKALDALQTKSYDQAIDHFNFVVNEEKFEIGGNELSDAYGYLALASTRLLELELEVKHISSIFEYQPLLKLAISETVRTGHYSKSKSLIKKSKITLITIIDEVIQTLSDSLILANCEHPKRQAVDLANFTIELFEHSKSDQILMNEKWRLYDLFGLAYYLSGDKNTALVNFEKSRVLNSQFEDQPASMLHLINYQLSGYYYHTVSGNYKKVIHILKRGKSYANKMILESEEYNIARVSLIKESFKTRLERTELGLENENLAGY